jgi:anaerobic magnesium-protoporphyrin IX monomethyl ester cyclase
MKILHIYPPYDFKDLYPQFMVKSKNGSGLVPGHLIKLGLLYIASYLRQEGHQVTFIDGGFNSQNQVINNIYKINPEMLLLSISTNAWGRNIKFISKLKKLFPKKYIVIGGPHPTGVRELCLTECSDVDFVCVGEGEHTMADLCKTLEKKKI